MKELEIKLDRESRIKLYHQLFSILKKAIENGDFAEGDKLPSIRTIAEKHEISRNTVIKAYKKLEESGLVSSSEKSGFFVGKPNIKSETVEELQENEAEKDSIPTVSSIITARAKEAKTENNTVFENLELKNKTRKKENLKEVKDSSTKILMNSGDVVVSENKKQKKITTPVEEFVLSAKSAIEENRNRFAEGGSIDPMGESFLRVAVAVFLYKLHHIDINPSNIVIEANRANFLFKLLSLGELRNRTWNPGCGLLRLAESSISEEEKTPIVAVPIRISSSLREAFRVSGFEMKELPFGSSGNVGEMLEKSGASLAFVYAKDLSTTQKQELSFWAFKEIGRYIIEYDNSTKIENIDFVFDIDKTERCIYLASFSNFISKSVNTAIAVLPKNLLESYKAQFSGFGCPVSLLNQMTLADFLIKDKLINYLSNLEQL